MNFRRLSETEAAEFTDSVLVSITDTGDTETKAGVVWMVDGNVVSDEGPMTVPAAMALATALAEEQGKTTVFVVCEPRGMIWKDEWGVVN